MSEIQTTVNYKHPLTLGLRLIQLLSFALVIVGFIWGTGDFISSFIPEDGPVTPLSLIFILYGGIGSGTIEVCIRLLNRKK